MVNKTDRVSMSNGFWHQCDCTLQFLIINRRSVFGPGQLLFNITIEIGCTVIACAAILLSMNYISCSSCCSFWSKTAMTVAIDKSHWGLLHSFILLNCASLSFVIYFEYFRPTLTCIFATFLWKEYRRFKNVFNSVWLGQGVSVGAELISISMYIVV